MSIKTFMLLAAGRGNRMQHLTKSLPKPLLDFHGKAIIEWHLEKLANFGIEDLVIITRSNKRANLFNQQVRARILWNEEEINSGDRMMVLKNNYFWLD